MSMDYKAMDLLPFFCHKSTDELKDDHYEYYHNTHKNRTILSNSFRNESQILFPFQI